MDYLNEMALFVEVAQTNGFSRAAAKLGMPQSTLSRRIAALEDALGLRLFNRSTRRLELTGAGAYYSGAVCNGFTAVFLVKIHGYRVKNARIAHSPRTRPAHRCRGAAAARSFG